MREMLSAIQQTVNFPKLDFYFVIMEIRQLFQGKERLCSPALALLYSASYHTSFNRMYCGSYE